MSTPAASPSESLQAQRILAMSVIGMVPILGVVSALVFDLHEYPSPLLAGGLFLLNVAAFGLAEVIGYKTPAIAPGTEPDAAQRQSVTAMQQSMILRFAVTEAPAILAFAGAAVTGSAWVYLVGGFWALLSMVWHVWPSRRIAAKLERSLERDGGRAHLTELFGGVSSPGYQQY
ncbi:hypothetical protein ASG73_09330 [Janibacter sp. Soil728]|uniref:hypothetical protein n=1 Tax=Janibacter sp. Soil728 TaxID=1736393 RepID=UPI0006FCD1E9|nr:hypothetical protein [Janibacter sp. Soil728]KRE37820.1 hypothetical protein ASG73_09330 [Janibacter sp. Soil728]